MLVNNNYPQKLVDEEINKFVAKKFDNNNNIKNNSVIKMYYENQMNKNIIKDNCILKYLIRCHTKTKINTTLTLNIFYKNKKTS